MAIDGLPKCLSIRDRKLFMDEQPLSALAEHFQTPLFVFSQSQIRSNIAVLRSALQNQACPVQLYYACKANSNRSILRIMHEAEVNLEVNSGGELWKGLQVGFRGEQILFNGVAKSDAEIEQALAMDVTLIIDSIAELHRCLTLSRYLGKIPRLLLRLIPNVEPLTTQEFQIGTASAKFGMELPEAYRAMEIILSDPNPIQLGLHLHLGGQISCLESFSRNIRFVINFLNDYRHLHLEDNWMPTLINLGGGLPCLFTHLSTTAEQLTGAANAILGATLDFEAFAKELQVLSNEGYRLALEPGRFFVANSAVLLTRVVNEKQREDGTRWLLLDAGCNVLMDVFLYHWLFELVSPDRIGEAHQVPYSVGGPLCDATDVFQSSHGVGHQPLNRSLPVGTGMGDILSFLDVGAYSLEQMNEYNGRLMPAAVLITEQAVQLIRRSQTLEDLFYYDPINE